jgi:hypothetical protein
MQRAVRVRNPDHTTRPELLVVVAEKVDDGVDAVGVSVESVVKASLLEEPVAEVDLLADVVVEETTTDGLAGAPELVVLTTAEPDGDAVEIVVPGSEDEALVSS